jgi:hypothetical protein
MTFLRPLVISIVAVLLIASAGAWWYFFGPNAVSAAQLVPGDTLAFATIPNAAGIGADYETSQLKKLVDSPNMQPVFDSIAKIAGQKNLDLLKFFLPNLSGQSFVALTHFDVNKPDETGFVAGMKPKPGQENFDAFVQQVNAAYPDLLRETTTGKSNLLGVDYQWIEGKNAKGRICVARYRGWIVTAWGEASLQDWLERMQGKPATPSLADNADYKKSVDRVGKDSQALLYFNYHDLMGFVLQPLARINPGQAAYLTKKITGLGGAAVGTRFEHGEIVDRFSVLESRQAQIESGVSTEPCPFETLKFTGPNTLFYLGMSMNWGQVWKNFQEQSETSNPMLKTLIARMQAWAQGEKLDLQKNIIDPLGSEYSMQLEWDPESLYPDIGIYLKVDKPDDFKPTIAALIDTIRKDVGVLAVITELNSNGRNYATLKTVTPMPIAPTMTEDGPWFGLFLNEQHAVRSFARDESAGLLHNDDFNRQIGGKRNGAMQLVFFDTPHFMDHAYRAALPYVSMGAMFNPKLGALLKGRQLPPDLAWLAPIGTWSTVCSLDDEGATGYSISGIGNQSILMAGGMVAAAFGLESSGLLPQHHYTQATPAPPVSGAPVPVPGMTNSAPVIATPPAPNAATNAAPADTNAPSATPATMTNAAPTDTNTAPADTNTPPAAMTNAAPIDTNAAPADTNAPATTAPTNSDANPSVTPPAH